MKNKKLLGIVNGITGDGIEMTLDQAKGASHQGQCTEDVRELSKDAEIKRQLAELGAEKIRSALKECGAWDDEELEDEDENEQRFVWLAAGDIVENN